MEKFPDHVDAPYMANGVARSPSREKSSPAAYPQPNGGATLSDRWQPSARRENGHTHAWPSSSGRGHGRQKSLSDAFRTIRARNGSMSQNAHEIADALRAPVSPKLVILCLSWYASSALTNTSSKSILIAFDKPATLTIVQFAFVSSSCMFLAWLATIFPDLRNKIAVLRHPIRKPNWWPFTQLDRHGQDTRVSGTYHQGPIPLFTVLAYRIFYDIRYPQATYLSLIPLTVGVMLACSGKHSYEGQLTGVLQALLATLIFVTQNIVSKKIFNEAAKAEAEAPGVRSKKLDKLNLLCYSSGMAFLVTLPIWFWSEGIGLLGDFLSDGAVDLSNNPLAMDHGRLTLEFIFNGVFHFSQNMLAFILLSMVSPVTYSVASLIKRVFVIVMAILWFRSPTTPVQAVGIALTFLGLYLYDRTSESNKADRKARLMTQSRTGTPLLPLSEDVSGASSPKGGSSAHPYTEGFLGAVTANEDSKKADDNFGRGRSGRVNAGWAQR
ncbi:hypothetical protein ACCO45_000757 [Purpureocillium lilacinum]|uniref:Uncharacterized protein n=1 Tax=Purpureocillium lilacinum TaxID=33203 RepID=A0ACC4E6A7_PURLI